MTTEKPDVPVSTDSGNDGEQNPETLVDAPDPAEQKYEVMQGKSPNIDLKGPEQVEAFSKEISDSKPLENAPTSTDEEAKMNEKICQSEQNQVFFMKSDEMVESSSSAAASDIYYVKRISFQKRPKRLPFETENFVNIILQNMNGPCPLLAIMNILLLQGRIVLPTFDASCDGDEHPTDVGKSSVGRNSNTGRVVSSQHLLQILADLLLTLPKPTPPSPESDDENKNMSPLTNFGGLLTTDFEVNMNDALGMLPQLTTGLDVNVKFGSVTDFEFTSNCIVFDLLGIRLFHGWLVDESLVGSDAYERMKDVSYNQLVERIVNFSNSEDQNEIEIGFRLQMFLDDFASQLTPSGLEVLRDSMKEHELAILFRNNHFSTIYKNCDKLYVLVTDQGFLDEKNIVWESLSNIYGNSNFFNSQFEDSFQGSKGQSPTVVSSTKHDEEIAACLSAQIVSDSREGAKTSNQSNEGVKNSIPNDYLTENSS